VPTQISEHILAALYNITDDAMIFLQESSFIDCNPACLSLFGYHDKTEFLSKHPAELSPPQQACGTESFELANQHIATALATGSHRFEWLHLRADTQQVFPAEVLLNAVTIENQHFIQATIRDISQRKFMEAELKRSNTDLEHFAYAVSHDMRQPLRMVTSYLSLLENSLAQQLDAEQQQFLHFALDGAKRMDAMILSLLDYSRVGHKTSDLSLISSRAALDEALAFLQPELQASAGTIAVYGDWIDIMMGRDELIRLLQNLIGNALKYHEENQVPFVEVCAWHTSTLFRVAVRDQGIGIDDQQIDRLFKVFSRLQPRSRFEGTGVGLALCRRIVERYGGHIDVASTGEGQGCVFWFELPILQVAEGTHDLTAS
jgi:PAS domain S-box-containing protein